ncbi:MAG: hypothetical protein ACRDZ8_00895, partial [Acidimicrobiales bacterium]
MPARRVTEVDHRQGDPQPGHRQPPSAPARPERGLLALQRQIGNRAVCLQLDRLAQGGDRDVIRRKVGFEFETGLKTASYPPKTTTKDLQAAMGSYQKRDYLHPTEDAPLVGGAQTLKAMKKKEPVVNTRANA